ncbi:merlin isoform X2 [Xenopus laevis]|uniref:Merlin isoform X2 n=2 Tax=Xenopus laevis TaxID=8355 RepID=A0A1L8HG68_XENLA|nr:merlin isoform X2 [Xenopus laevis]XP_018102426.1 merlin isoform X2 [Xenopus laevis]OCT95090.1 hypothetical protein XELAEV_18012774mg [Xenopus laevis]
MSIRRLTRKQLKFFRVKVMTLDSEIELNCKMNWKGSVLFGSVCETLGLKESWFFGLQFTSNGMDTWLKLDKKILQQDLPKEEPTKFRFLAKFYPENVAEELVQDITRHLFFLQVKKQILDEEIHCSPEASVLLALYALQAKYGDYNPNIHQPGFLSKDELLPQRVLQQYQMTSEMWQEKITAWYAEHRGTDRNEAEMNYLKIAQDLDMYGMNYFPVLIYYQQANTDSAILLGVNAKGIHIFSKNNKIMPSKSFKWGDISNISYNYKRLKIAPINRKDGVFKFYSPEDKVNRLILDLCIGNHNLFITKRKVDSKDIQQMKNQAKLERTRKKIEHQNLIREKQLREDAERAKDDIERRLFQLEDEARQANEALIHSNEATELMAEKAQIAEEEAKLLAQNAVEARQEMQRLEIAVLSSKEELQLMEQKMREADMITVKLMKESDRRAKEAEKLEQDLHKAREAELIAKQRLMDLSSLCEPLVAKCFPPNVTDGVTDNRISLDASDTDIKRLSLEIEKERLDYLEKSRQIESQLNELKTELRTLKREDRQLSLQSLWNGTFRSKDHFHDTLWMETYGEQYRSPLFTTPSLQTMSTVSGSPDWGNNDIRTQPLLTQSSFSLGRASKRNIRQANKNEFDVIYI